jgi:hypothetical protein
MWVWVILAVASVLAQSTLSPRPARAQVGDAGAPSPRVDAGVASELEREFRKQARAIRHLLLGRHEPDVVATSLFVLAPDVSAERARVEVRRLGLVLARAAERSRASASGGADAGGATARGGDGSERSLDPRPLDPGQWRARIVLDEQRLAFYSLPAERRVELLRAHEQRRSQVLQLDRKEAINDAERAAEQAAQQQREALEAARLAAMEAPDAAGVALGLPQPARARRMLDLSVQAMAA